MQRTNKYNIRALQEELVDCARNGRWNKFRHRVQQLLEQLQQQQNQDPAAISVLQSVVLRNRVQRNRGGTLLHVVLHLYRETKTRRSLFLCELIALILRAVPQVLYATDENLQTPLHVAIERRYPGKVIQVFMDAILVAHQAAESCAMTSSANKKTKNNPLFMADDKGETPLHFAAIKLKYADRHAYEYLEILLRDKRWQKQTLGRNKNKKRVPLWYAARFEVRTVCTSHHTSVGYLMSEEVQSLLLATQAALWERQNDDDKNDNAASAPLHSTTTTTSTIATDRLVCTAVLVTCAHMLEHNGVKLCNLILRSHYYRPALITPDPSTGNTLLHLLCRHKPTEWEATHALVMEQVLQFLSGTPEESNGLANHDDRTMIRSSLLVSFLSLSNQQGNVPLHFAAASQKNYVGTLVQAYPDALHLPNHQGELPLHVALKQRSDDNGDETFLTTVETLWHAATDTLTMRDGATQLFPFCLAAIETGSSSLRDDLVFRLLLDAPEVLAMTQSRET